MQFNKQIQTSNMLQASEVVMYVVQNATTKKASDFLHCSMYLVGRNIVIVFVVFRLLNGNELVKKSCESVRLPEGGYHVSPNSNTLSPALCVGYATFTDTGSCFTTS